MCSMSWFCIANKFSRLSAASLYAYEHKQNEMQRVGFSAQFVLRASVFCGRKIKCLHMVANCKLQTRKIEHKRSKFTHICTLHTQTSNTRTSTKRAQNTLHRSQDTLIESKEKKQEVLRHKWSAAIECIGDYWMREWDRRWVVDSNIDIHFYSNSTMYVGIWHGKWHITLQKYWNDCGARAVPR